MNYELAPQLAKILVLTLIVVHLSLFVVSRKISPIYVFAGLFLMFSPISGIETLSTLGYVLKWVKLYALIMILLIGILWRPLRPLGPAARIWLAFLAFYVLSAVWGDVPHLGLRYKGLVGLTALCGVVLAYHIRDRKELIRVLRFLCVVSGICGLFFLGMFYANPQIASAAGRMAAAGAHPGRYAQLVGPLLLLCSHLALYDRSVRWRLFAGVVCALLASVLFFTACRGQMAACFVGFSVQVVPMTRRPIRSLTLILLTATICWVAMQYAEGALRFSRIFTAGNTRAKIWGAAMETFGQAPLFGHGWVHVPDAQGSLNMHSIWLQVATESGLLGVALLLACFLFVLHRTFRMHRFVRQNRALVHLSYLPISMIIAILFAGIIYNSLAVPSPTTLVMAFMIGLVDRLPELAIRENRQAFLCRTYIAGALRPLRG